MNNKAKSRRQFVKLASGLLATPFCTLSGVNTFAQESDPTKAPLRFLTILDSYGLPRAGRDQMWIRSSANDYPLADADLGTILSPLSAYKDNMLVLSGMNMDSHAVTRDSRTHANITIHTLTGSRSVGGETDPSKVIQHASVDVHIGNYLNNTYGLPSPRPYSHLLLSDYAEPTKATFSFDPTGKQIRSIAGAKNIAANLFGSVDDTAQLQLKFQAQQDVLNLVSEQVRSVRAELINANKNVVMDAYQSSVDALTTELQLRKDNICQAPGNVDAFPDPSRVASQTSPYIFDNIYQAFNCDLVSSITYPIGGETINQLTHANLYNAEEHNSAELQTLLRRNFHGPSHRTDDAANKAHEVVRTYQASLIANLLDRMAVTPDINGGTLLDNTVVFWTSAMSNNTHQITDYGHLLIAGQNTGLKGGFHYNCSQNTNNDLLTTLARGLTLPDDRFGGHDRNGVYIDALNNGPISKLLKA